MPNPASQCIALIVLLTAVAPAEEVAPSSQESYLRVYEMYRPLFDRLSPEASDKLRKGNYERLFDAARRKVRAWEKEHVK